MTIVQATRVGAGRVPPIRSLAERGWVAADDLQPWKARILLRLALAAGSTTGGDPGPVRGGLIRHPGEVVTTARRAAHDGASHITNRIPCTPRTEAVMKDLVVITFAHEATGGRRGRSASLATAAGSRSGIRR